MEKTVSIVDRLDKKCLNETLLDFSIEFITNFIRLLDIDSLSYNEMDCSSTSSVMKEIINENMDLNSSLLSSERRVISQLNQLNQDMSKTLVQSGSFSLTHSKTKNNMDVDSAKSEFAKTTYKQIINQILTCLPDHKGSKSDIIERI